MEPYEEKRRYPRYNHQSPMNLYRMDEQDQSYYAEMKDYSKGGLSLVTTEKFVIGQFVYLEMKNYDKAARGPENQKSYSGSVKWASPYPSTSGAKILYRYGVEC